MRTISEQYNLEIIKLMHKFLDDEQLFNLSKSLESRASNLAANNLAFREAKSSLFVKLIRDINKYY